MTKRNHLCFLGSGHYEEQFCKIIFGLVVQGRISIKDFSFLFLALVVILFGGPEPFVLPWLRILWETLL